MCLYDYIGDAKRFHFHKRMCINPKWIFDSSFMAFGIAILNQNGEIEWREEFRGGPFRIPPGGEICVNLGDVYVGSENLLIKDLLDGKYEQKAFNWKQMGF